MKKHLNRLIVVQLFFLVGIFETNGQSVLALSDSSEVVYRLSTLNNDANLLKMLQVSDNKEFVSEFDSLYATWFDIEKQHKELLKANIDDWEIALFETRNEQIKFLNSYDKQLSKSFTELIKSSIEWNYWHLLFAYPILRSNKDTESKRMVSLPRIMLANFKKDELKKEELLNLKSFRSLLPFAITYLNSEEQKFIKYADRTKLVKDKTEFASKLLTNKALDYYSTLIISENCPYLTPSSAKYFISNIYDITFQKHLVSVCDETLNRKEVVEEKSKTNKLNSAYPTLMDLEDKPFDFSAYKGKVIYVDFWASWCGPCRAEFPKSREMHESLTEKQKKEIVFLYISIDEDLQAWKNAVEKLNLDESGKNGHSYEVSGRYNIRSIPRYMIINKAGEIIEMEASRPSNPETLNTLLKLLE